MALTLGKKLVIVMLTILGSWTSQATSRTLHEAFMVERHEQWMAQYDRKYADDAEKESRFKIFKENAEFVEKINSVGNHSYKLSLNAFSDLTTEEFVASRTGYKITNQSRSTNVNTSFRYENLSDIPMTMDWREQGAVTPVKNQGQCGKKITYLKLS
jgi:KDEL-tailed cysteine endopeptidase